MFFLLTSCGSKKDVIYFQDVRDIQTITYDSSYYDIRIIPNDNLLITVSALNQVAASDFNTVRLGQSGGSYNLEWQGYLVDESGDINFPVVGKVHLGGLTKSEAVDLLQQKVSQYINDPIVNIRFMNYKIHIMGEVNRPGTYTITDEKVSIPEALAMAGDMTIYGNRHEVMIYRVENGEKKSYHLDMTSSSVFFSEAYYLQQNDILYVQPNTTKVRSSTNISPYVSLFISSATFILTLYTLFTR
jgi:polysaccharide export outer membrane protein